MLAGDVVTAFRDDVYDTVEPYLWSTTEILRCVRSAVSRLASETGGLADASSEATEADVAAGEAYIDLHESILKIRGAFLNSTGDKLAILNFQDDEARSFSTEAGYIKALVIGEEEHKARLVLVPAEDDSIKLVVYRKPLSLSEAFTVLSDIEYDEDYLDGLLLGVKEKAYLKQDVDTFDKTASERNGEAFTAYIFEAKREADRRKAKPAREVVYGGI